MSKLTDFEQAYKRHMVLSNEPYKCNKEDIPEEYWEISRTSRRDVEEHTRVVVEIPYLDVRTCSLEEIRKGGSRWHADYLATGYGHTEVNGRAQRYSGTTTLHLTKIATFEELRALVKEEGEIILSADGIEIYDDYRE